MCVFVGCCGDWNGAVGRRTAALSRGRPVNVSSAVGPTNAPASGSACAQSVWAKVVKGKPLCWEQRFPRLFCCLVRRPVSMHVGWAGMVLLASCQQVVHCCESCVPLVLTCLVDKKVAMHAEMHAGMAAGVLPVSHHCQ